MTHRNTTHQSGFTIIELVISMAFISFLLMFMLYAMVSVTRTYTKGLAIRQMNQAGRQFSEDFTRTARYSVGVNSDAAMQRICVGGVTYAWNIGDPKVSAVNKNKFATGVTTGADISMVKVEGNYCGSTAPLPRALAKDLLPADLNVQAVTFALRESDKIFELTTTFSTGGNNAPQITPTGPQCDPGSDGAYCAFATYSATVYVRGQ